MLSKKKLAKKLAKNPKIIHKKAKFEVSVKYDFISMILPKYEELVDPREETHVVEYCINEDGSLKIEDGKVKYWMYEKGNAPYMAFEKEMSPNSTVKQFYQVICDLITTRIHDHAYDKCDSFQNVDIRNLCVKCTVI